MVISKRTLKLLEPYLIGQEPHPGKNGMEWDMRCPLHPDAKRSAQLNLDLGVFHCKAGCGGMRVRQLVRRKDEWKLPDGKTYNGHAQVNDEPEALTEEMVRQWCSDLTEIPGRLDELMSIRGLEPETIEAYEIGWDNRRGVYTLPVRDELGVLANVRRYDPHPAIDRRKMYSARGLGSPARLYPISVLTDDEPDEIIICEGEWDALLTIQNGFHAITRTASAITWDNAWGHYFEGKTVYVCHDCDDAGRDANVRVAKALHTVADVRIVRLPFPHAKKHGKDLTDYWLFGHEEGDFRELLDAAKPLEDDKPTTLDPTDASVLDTFDSHRVGDSLKVTVTIKGKRDPGYSVPSVVRFTCTRDAGQKCAVCPLNAASGDDTIIIEGNDPMVLEMMESSRKQLADVLRQSYGIPTCSKLTVEPTQYQAVEVLYARPSVEHVNGDSSAYKNMKVTSVGRHNTMPNNTVAVVGALHPDPRSQQNEFLAWEVQPLRSGLDNFTATPQAVKRMKTFRPRPRQKPLDRLYEIAEDHAAHVTRIYGRPEVHIGMDLVFHSVTAFRFAGQLVEKGWLEFIVVGDTRTGKSEIATGLVRHYHAGELVLCESASFAGVVGGLQQYGSGKEWAISWGAIPLNDRRLVVLDEVSGLTTDQIAAMSDVRSRGVAQLTKIQQEATPARTRLIWTGNVRDGGMADFTYGVQALVPLIGNAEDIARFDFAMSLRAGEVDASEINRYHRTGRQRWGTAACSALVRWVWSRKPDQVVWADGAEEAVFTAASELGEMYVETPPLVQTANVRIKVARLAVAVAARLFSTTADQESILVRKSHVRAAVDYLNTIYNMPGFGYGELSRELIADAQEARAKRKEIKKWLTGRRGLAKLLRNNSKFRRQDIEEVLNVSREEANAVINTLWEARMVKKDKGDVRVQPELHALLREVRE